MTATEPRNELRPLSFSIVHAKAVTMSDRTKSNLRITSEQAVEIARRAAEENQYPFVGEVVVWDSCDNQLHVMSNAECRGMNVNVWIDRDTGAVVDIGLTLR